ncbi:hypothetical protein NXX20_04375 [Bacteroides stercoris]|nr:hypothetical protein [Bacteroides stercoris]
MAAAATADLESAPPNAPRTDPGIASEGIASEPRTAIPPVRKKFRLSI